MRMTRWRLVVMLGLALAAGCSHDDGARETSEFRPNFGVVSEGAPLVVSDVMSAARLGDTVVSTVDVALWPGSTPMDVAVAAASRSDGVEVTVVPDSLALEPGATQQLDVTVTIPSDEREVTEGRTMYVAVDLDGVLLDDRPTEASGLVAIELVAPGNALPPVVVDDAVFWEGDETVDVLANDRATDGDVGASSLRVVRVLPASRSIEPIVEGGQIAIPAKPNSPSEGALIVYEVCSTNGRCSQAALTLFVEGSL